MAGERNRKREGACVRWVDGQIFFSSVCVCVYLEIWVFLCICCVCMFIHRWAKILTHLTHYEVNRVFNLFFSTSAVDGHVCHKQETPPCIRCLIFVSFNFSMCRYSVERPSRSAEHGQRQHAAPAHFPECQTTGWPCHTLWCGHQHPWRHWSGLQREKHRQAQRKLLTVIIKKYGWSLKTAPLTFDFEWNVWSISRSYFLCYKYCRLHHFDCIIAQFLLKERERGSITNVVVVILCPVMYMVEDVLVITADQRGVCVKSGCCT